MSSWTRFALIAALLAPALLPAVARADLPADRRAQLVLKALSYNRSIKARATGEVPFAVLSNGSSCHDAVAALQSSARKSTVAGLPVKVVELVYAGSAATEKALADSRALAVFVCPELGAQVPQIVALTRKLDLMSFSGVEEHIRQGIALGVVERGSRAAILTNMKAIAEEGVDLDSALMRFAGTMR